MDQVVITIARQYGSGGRTVGKMLAERLGISFYDKQIIQMASDESGVSNVPTAWAACVSNRLPRRFLYLITTLKETNHGKNFTGK